MFLIDRNITGSIRWLFLAAGVLAYIAKNEDHVGHVMKETDDKIVCVFDDSNYNFDIPNVR
jgi:hypothetical protein